MHRAFLLVLLCPYLTATEASRVILRSCEEVEVVIYDCSPNPNAKEELPTPKSKYDVSKSLRKKSGREFPLLITQS